MISEKTKPLRLVHIAKYYPPDSGGMEFFIKNLAEEQAKKGHEVLVLAHARKVPPGIQQENPRLTVKRFPVWSIIGNYAPFSPGILLNIKKLPYNFKPQLIHLHCPNPAGAAIWPFPSSIPLVLHWHSDVVFPPQYSPVKWQLKAWRKLEKGLLKRASKIITTSPNYGTTSNVLQNYLNKIDVVPLGLPESEDLGSLSGNSFALNWLKSRPKGTRLISIGRLSHYKGFPVLLKALTHLPQISLCLIGDGEEREKLKALSHELDVQSRVFFAGQISTEEREACLEAADIFCLPSLDRTEAFGLVLLEAMRAGLACVATTVEGSGMSYALDYGDSGMLVEPGSIQSLVKVISTLSEDSTYREKLAYSGRQRFLKQFTISSISQDIDKVYYKMLESCH